MLVMNIKYSNIIILEKELSNLDEFTINFTKKLNQSKTKYAIVSGYVSILFGRNRASEDIDLILERMTFDKFQKIWIDLVLDFECLNTDDPKTAYSEYLINGISIRFSRKKEYLPNMEIKFPKNELDQWTIENSREVKINNNTIYISPLELQIPFKIWLGTEKDLEDARYLYQLFKKDINKEIMTKFNRQLKIEDTFNRMIA